MTNIMVSPKRSIKEVLEILVDSLINGDEYKLTIGKLPDNKTLVLDISVNPKKVGIMLGKMDEFGKNPTKIAVYRIMKQVGFYHGFTNVVLNINEIKVEKVSASS